MKKIFKVKMIAILSFGFVISSFSGSNIAEKGLVYYLSFNKGLKAEVSRNGSSEPTVAKGIKFVKGINGKGVYVGGWGERNYRKAPLLEYNGEKLFGKEGTISFWVSPDWDGYFTDPYNFPWYFFFMAVGGKEDADFITKYISPKNNYGRISLFMWNWLRCDLHKEDGKGVSLRWKCRNAWMKGDWWYIALTWKKGEAKLYVNGIPENKKENVELEDIQKFYIGSLPNLWVARYRANSTFDEFKIYNRALSDEEIRKNFRRYVPVDFIFERRYLRAEEKEKAKIGLVNKTGKRYFSGKLRMELLSDSGDLIKKKEIKIKMRDKKWIELPVQLEEGNYRLSIQVGNFRRSFPVIVYTQKPAPVETEKDLEIGEKIMDIDCTKEENGFVSSCKTEVKEVKGIGKYREGGAGKWDRFGYEVKIPEGSGSPLLLEITWPDDKERSMAFYMIAKRKREWLRDRLGGGVQCGGEYPNTGKMVASRYLFYPETDEYLFEVRTLVTGMPAAVSSLRIYRIKERLPELKINLTGKQKYRNFGHLDEDQSFELLISQKEKNNLKFGRTVSLIETFLDYMDYTGQNIISYPVLRYWWSYLDQPSVNKAGGGLRTTGWINLMLDMFERRGKKFIMGIHLFTIPSTPEFNMSVEDRIKEGYFWIDKNGKPYTYRKGMGEIGTNILHPEVRKQFFDLISDILERFGSHPAFDGIDLWNSERNSVFFPNLNLGYGDYTIKLFEKETGIKVPGKDASPERFYKRYEYLTGEKKEEWLRWRAKKTYEFVKELSNLLKQRNKTLYLSLRGYWAPYEILYNETCENVDFKKGLYENLSIDLSKIEKLSNVVIVPMRFNTSYRWLKHWHGGNVENLFNELNWNINKFKVFSRGEKSSTAIYPGYYESFMKSLKPEKYKTYFQNADPKPWGRYFLQDLTVAIASQDTSQILIGAQPPGTWGREKEAREWAKAFRSLPAGDFEDIKGLDDPVCGRYLETKEGTYFYAVNLIWMPVKAVIKNIGKVKVIDLSTGEEIKTNGKFEIELSPFQLRSFFVENRRISHMEGKAEVSSKVKRWYSMKLKQLRETIEELEKNGADVKKYRSRLEKIENAITHNHFQEAHRLIFSKMMRKLPDLVKLSKKGYLKKMAEMISKSQYAINCGSGSFYMSESGILFFPDRKFEKGEYGYYGSYMTVIRPVSGIKVEDKKLYETEAYNISGYKFTVKPGKYTVKLYMKVGYERGAKPGVFVFNVDIEGKRVLEKFDLFKACGEDFWKTTIKEFKGIEVKDGVLDIDFSVPEGIDPTARLCNAIQIIPQKIK